MPRDFPGVKNHHVDVVELVGRKSFQGLEVLPPRDERTFLHRHGLSRGRIDALGDTLEHVMIELVRRARWWPGGRSRRVARRSSGRPLVEFGLHGHTTARP